MSKINGLENKMEKAYKKTSLMRSKIEVRPSLIHGYGVFAIKKILPEETIEECPLILLKKSEPLLGLKDMAFQWDHNFHILALGYGSLYNHAEHNNAKYYRDDENQLLIFKATKTIYPNEEIFTNYGNEWFTARGIEIKNMPRRTHYRDIIRLILLGLLLVVCYLALPIK